MACGGHNFMCPKWLTLELESNKTSVHGPAQTQAAQIVVNVPRNVTDLCSSFVAQLEINNSAQSPAKSVVIRVAIGRHLQATRD